MAPETGGDCPLIGMECPYQVEEPCGPVTQRTYECTADGWSTIYPACSPEPTCPDEMPLPGSDCSGWEYPYFCQYDVFCGDQISTVAMSCDYTDPPLWKVDTFPAECSCGLIGDAAACSVMEGCRWLVPGCGDGPQVAEGCYPAADCQVDACPPTDTCVVLGYDPCWNSKCEACGADTGVCQPLTD
jgi:hypothetical protein